MDRVAMHYRFFVQVFFQTQAATLLELCQIQLASVLEYFQIQIDITFELFQIQATILAR